MTTSVTANLQADAEEVERHECPRCGVQAGSPCRSRTGAVTGTYHTGRVTSVGRPATLLRVPTPADRRPGQPWRPGTAPPEPLPTDGPVTDIRVGYARSSPLTQELQYQLDALAARGIDPANVHAEKISLRVRVRPRLEAALDACRRIKAQAPQCRVILTVHELKRLGRDSTELTALADHLTAHGIALEMLAGPLPGIYDPSGPGRMLFAFFAAMAETDREAIRETTLEGLDAAARKGNHGGRPPVITDDMLHTLLRRRAAGEAVDAIRLDLVIPTGKRKGHNPSPASVYRALAEHDRRQCHPDIVDQARAEHAELTAPTAPATAPATGTSSPAGTSLPLPAVVTPRWLIACPPGLPATAHQVHGRSRVAVCGYSGRSWRPSEPGTDDAIARCRACLDPPALSVDGARLTSDAAASDTARRAAGARRRIEP